MSTNPNPVYAPPAASTPGFATPTAPASAAAPAPAAVVPPPIVAPPAPPPNQLSAFASAQATTDAQRQALLAEVARAGAAGAAQYATAQSNQQTLGAETTRRAMEIAGGSPLTNITGGYDVVTDPVGQDFARMEADLLAGRQAFDQDIARQTAAGQQYFGRLSQAIPITESRTRAEVEQIIAKERQAAAERAFAVQMANMEAQAAREDMAFRREQYAYERQLAEMSIRERQAAAQREERGDPLVDALRRQDLRRGRLELEAFEDERRATRETAALSDVLDRYTDGPESPQARAIAAAINGGGDADALNEVFRNAGRYDIDPDDQTAILSAVRAYNEAMGINNTLIRTGTPLNGSQNRRRTTEGNNVAANASREANNSLGPRILRAIGLG